MSDKKKCFVVMGFGKKPDYATGRTLDLDGTYEAIIRRAVEDAGLECIRADDIVHAGIIDKPMYELLYSADLVVADLSTSNANAIYELGVRHALKPNTTIVIAENQFKFPFDIKSLLIRTYTHLGEGIDFREANRMYKALKEAIEILINEKQTDSPVYTFLNDLQIPNRFTVANIAASMESVVLPAAEDSIATLMNLFKEARSQKTTDWTFCISLLNKMLEKKPEDIYLNQQLALATYKSKKPDAETALNNAKKILEKLNPIQTTDPETLGLWGAVYKRYWDLWEKGPHLDEAIWAYEKGFYLKNDFYNGINFAFLLNVRASVSEGREAIADVVTAERIRKRVIDICNNILNQQNDAGKTVFIGDAEQKYWLQASLVEAYLGTGQKEESNKLKETISKGDANWKPEQWMIDTMNEQLAKLSGLLEKAAAIE